MGHGMPNMVGVETKGLDQKIQQILPDYMSMGTAGMGDMPGMRMPGPSNSLAMQMSSGQFKGSPIDMGGMFTIIKVREQLQSYSDPGWYKSPSGTVATTADPAELRRDLGIEPSP
jgi:hypothetical protein